MLNRILLILLCFPFIGLAQNQKKYQGLLWKISGNGLEHPSYLYGTMHVSNRVAFHLSESFFDALDSAEIVALETNPQYWISDIRDSELFQELFAMSYRSGSRQFPLYSTFIPNQPKQAELANYLARDQDMLNGLLWRFNQGDQDFEENTFLDLFIYQAGKKMGKKVTALEDFEGSFKSVMLSGKYDEDAKPISDRQAREILGDYETWQELQEDAYRKGDLDLLDTLTSSLNPGKYHRKNMLDIRNRIMAEGMDSIMRKKRLFTGVGAAHLPGKNGVINMLRKMGYTVEPEERSITTHSIEEKETIDEIIYTHEMKSFKSEDGFIATTSPGEMLKVSAAPHQEYLFADMANGAFYSIKRISTFGSLYARDTDNYKKRIDSLLFENIPGKIINRKNIEISGYPALEIENKTKKGDWHRYNIIYTPLEIIIVKVGGHKEFVKTKQAVAFFENLKLEKNNATQDLYTPASEAFKVDLPKINRIENYEGIYFNPFNTFWAQSQDKDGDYYAVAYRQYYDFYYIEEDAFELEYFIEKIEDEDKLSIDTMYTIESDHPALKFELSDSKENKLFGEVHISGPRYVMMLSRDGNQNEREDFFKSFSFNSNFAYPDEFETYTDTAMHITMRTPIKLNNFSSFISGIYNRGYYGSGNSNYGEKNTSRLFVYKPTGEQLSLNFKKFQKYASYENSEDVWESYKEKLGLGSLILLEEKLISSEIRDSSYFKEVKELRYTDTNSTRQLWKKVVIENGAAYSLTANVDGDKPSQLVKEAFASFDSSGDTLIGTSILHSKSGLFFADLASKDSTRVYEAKNSIYSTSFEKKDGKRIKEYVENYKYEDFTREDRLKLLNRLAFIDDNSHIDYFANMYYKYLDSSAYQFAILEALADFETKKGNKEFLRLILDETPFSSSSYAYSNLIYELDDSIQIVNVVFPKLLELTDFEDYKEHVYGLLKIAVDSGAVESKNYKNKYNTILRYAKVELKKQKASDETNSTASYNNSLNRYVSLLKPFSKKKEVKDLYKNLLTIKNKEVLLSLVEIIHEAINIPDTVYNYIASDEEALAYLYSFLETEGKTQLLNPKYKTQEAISLSLAQGSSYSTFDTISFIEKRAIEIQGKPSEVYFYRARQDDDDLWDLVYVAVPKMEGNKLTTKYEMRRSGESYNPDYDDIKEIIDDTLKEIRVYGRRRVVSANGYY